jgi:hypothetical protein
MEYFILYPDCEELDPVTYRSVTISHPDIAVQLVHQLSKILGHKIMARMVKINVMDKL